MKFEIIALKCNACRKKSVDKSKLLMYDKDVKGVSPLGIEIFLLSFRAFLLKTQKGLGLFRVLFLCFKFLE